MRSSSRTYLVRGVFHVNHVTGRMVMELGKNKKSYGAVTLSTRGQIAMPAQARRDFDIKPGEKLLVLDDLQEGIVLTKATIMACMMAAILKGLATMRDMLGTEPEDESERED
jgi:AbrB family looped-hinge helix DNA binding protein